MDDLYCKTCKIVCINKYILKRHYLSKKHLKNQEPATAYRCTECDYIGYRHDNYERHMDTHKLTGQHTCVQCYKGYKTQYGLWKHGKKCEPTTLAQVTKDPNLVLRVMEKLVAQNDILIKQGTTIYQTVNHVNKFNLNVFLTEQCRDAMNWSDFITNIQVNLEDIDISSNITDKVVRTICSELDRLGMYKRPIHCTDIKRHRTCIKDKNEWSKDSIDLLQQGITKVSHKYQKVLHEWAARNPLWHEDQALTEKYVEMMHIFMKEPEERSILLVCKKTILTDV